MEELAVIVVRGLGLGAVFALVAMSLNAVHRASGIFNFAQGAMMVLGGIIAARYMPNVPDPYRWLLFLPVATIALAAIMTHPGVHYPAAAALFSRAALLAGVHPGGLRADRRGHSPAARKQPDPHDQPVSELSGVRHAHACAVHHGDRTGARLVCGAALVSQPHAHRPVDQRRRAGSRRRACGRSARAQAADARLRHQRDDHRLDRIYRGADPGARERQRRRLCDRTASWRRWSAASATIPVRCSAARWSACFRCTPRSLTAASFRTP